MSSGRPRATLSIGAWHARTNRLWVCDHEQIRTGERLAFLAAA
jgi:hypothetical protein